MAFFQTTLGIAAILVSAVLLPALPAAAVQGEEPLPRRLESASRTRQPRHDTAVSYRTASFVFGMVRFR